MADIGRRTSGTVLDTRETLGRHKRTWKNLRQVGKASLSRDEGPDRRSEIGCARARRADGASTLRHFDTSKFEVRDVLANSSCGGEAKNSPGLRALLLAIFSILSPDDPPPRGARRQASRFSPKVKIDRSCPDIDVRVWSTGPQRIQ